MRDDKAFLQDILERITLTETFVKDGKEGFFSSRIAQEAVIRNLEVIGEACRAISEDFKTAHPEVPWREISAFRDFVIHVYWSINLERIWQIIDQDLIPLKTEVTKSLNSMDDNEESG